MNIVGPMIKIALQGIAGLGVFPGRAPDGSTSDYIVYTAVGDATNQSLNGKADLQSDRVQIDIYHSSYLTAHEYARRVVTAMLAQSHLGSPSSFTATQLSEPMDFAEPETRAHRVMLEFRLWHY